VMMTAGNMIVVNVHRIFLLAGFSLL